MLRALKLIGQYDFTMDAATENALFSELELIRVAAPSRLALELEKILSSAYGDKHFQAFHDYGLLPYFLEQPFKKLLKCPSGSSDECIENVAEKI